MLEKPSKVQLMFNSQRLLTHVPILSSRSLRLSKLQLRVLALPFHAMVSFLIPSAQHWLMKLLAFHLQLHKNLQQQLIEFPQLLLTSSELKDLLKMIELISLSSSEKNSMKTKRENKFFLVLLPQLPRHLRGATLLTTQLYPMVLLHWMTCSPLRDGSVTEDLLSALPLVSLNSKMLLMLLMKLLLPLRSRRPTPSSNSGRPEEVTSNTKAKMRHSM